MKKVLKVIAIMLCPILLIGCATIVSGRIQRVPVSTRPSDAKVTVNGMIQRSPAILTLDRTIPAYQIIIEKPGYETVEYTIRRGLNGWVFGNIILGGWVGIIIDCVTGSVYAFNPSEIDINLVPKDSVVITESAIITGEKL